jgi:hypothetical protein
VAKNKGKYHGSEDPAASAAPDEFVSFWDHIGERLKPHAAKIATLVGAIALAVIIGIVWGWWTTRREKASSAALEQALKIGEARVVGDGEPPPPAGSTEPTYKSAKERSEAELAALSKIEGRGGSVPQKVKLVKAGVLFDLGRYDEAAAAYKTFLGTSAPDVLKLVAREGLGYSLEAKALAEKDAGKRAAGLDAALAEFKQLQPDEKGFYRDEALYHQARILQLKGDKAGATALYKQIADGMPGSPVAPKARDRLAALEQ